MHRYLLIGELLLIVLPITGLFILFIPIAIVDMLQYSYFPSLKAEHIYVITSIVLAPWALLSLWIISIKYIATPVKHNVSLFAVFGLVVGILLCIFSILIADDLIASVVVFGLPILPATHLLILLK